VLFSWYKQARESNIPVDGNVLCEKVKKIAAHPKIENFAVSNSWITRFKDRHGLVYEKLAGESAAVDSKSTEVWLERLPALLEGYNPHDIYNADETGFFFSVLPDRTLALKRESCHGGKSSQDKLIVFLCVNTDRSDKQVPVVIKECPKPRCFKNIVKNAHQVP
jgi:hypothetical protein